ncbi:hypothetical protein BANRA_02460 [Acinetobacter baumannii]|nr:hypothetical protein BANRA_02460 [Acinetobacter baumannii]
MKSHDHLLDRQYDEDHYNCVHFVHEAAMDLYGIDRAEALELFMQPKGKITFLSSRLKLLNPLLSIAICEKILHLMESGVTYLPEEVVMEMGFNQRRKDN